MGAAIKRLGLGLALVVLGLILAIYLQRVVMALPLYASDEGSYLIRALIPADAITRNPYASDVNNTAYFLLIRLVHLTGEHYMPWLRAVGLAAYAGGLMLVFRANANDLASRDRVAFLLLAFAFPYYRFVVTTLPEGVYVGVLGLIALVTARLYRPKPLRHAILAGALVAVLLLVKPHGLAVAAGMIALMIADVIWSGGGSLRVLAMRIAAFLLAFVSVGAAVQVLAGHSSDSALTLFIGEFYGRTLEQARPPGAERMGVLALIGMGSTVALFAGPALLIGLQAIVCRRLRNRGPLGALQSSDLMFMLLALSLAATMAMVAIFTMQIAGSPGEMKRIWGRYFEFYVPMIWLAAAPYLVRAESRPSWRITAASAGLALAGLLGLLFCFRHGVVLFPWDNTALQAFFAPDPVRAPLGSIFPYRMTAIAITVAALGLLLATRRPSRVWLAYFLAIGLTSSVLDYLWIGQMMRERTQLDQELHAADRWVPDTAGRSVLIAADPNLSQLGFLAFDGAPTVIVQPPGPIPNEAMGTPTIVVLGATPSPHPGAGWRQTYDGGLVDVFSRQPGAAAPN